MMFSPEYYIRLHADDSLEELRKERDKLISWIRSFEENGPSPDEVFCSPSPEARYHSYLLFLAKICELIADKDQKGRMQLFWQELKAHRESEDKIKRWLIKKQQ
ncbi:MAG: hypothetical protein IJR51_06720 [Clostridia bacterium]|nr:hypothetical protein [Clostridia bacterium]MBQ9506833.1 hypothetical protein [Clostridia bacterium]